MRLAHHKWTVHPWFLSLQWCHCHSFPLQNHGGCSSYFQCSFHWLLAVRGENFGTAATKEDRFSGKIELIALIVEQTDLNFGSLHFALTGAENLPRNAASWFARLSSCLGKRADCWGCGQTWRCCESPCPKYLSFNWLLSWFCQQKDEKTDLNWLKQIKSAKAANFNDRLLSLLS